MTPRILSKSFLSIVAGAVAGLSLGCVITTSGGGNDECGGILSHSHETGNGTCKCDAGYTWENPDDPEDFDCERIEGKNDPNACTETNNVLDGNVCYCEGGYIWCNPDDANDYSCCIDDAQDALSGTDDPTSASDVSDTVAETGTDTSATDPTAADTTDSSDTSNDSGAEPDPADCSVDTPDALFCSNTAEAGPEGSVYYTCVDGTWTENATAGDELCMFDGYAFAYGCVDDGSAIAFVCGNGPGTACDSNADATCVDADVINTCLFGRLTEDSCATICNTIGDDMGITYDSGFCDPDATPPECFCCDAGEEGCPA